MFIGQTMKVQNSLKKLFKTGSVVYVHTYMWIIDKHTVSTPYLPLIIYKYLSNGYVGIFACWLNLQ